MQKRACIDTSMQDFEKNKSNGYLKDRGGLKFSTMGSKMVFSFAGTIQELHKKFTLVLIHDYKNVTGTDLRIKLTVFFKNSIVGRSVHF